MLLTQFMFADLKGIFCCKQSSWVPDENLGPVGPYKRMKKNIAKDFQDAIMHLEGISTISQNACKVLSRLHLIHQCACVPAHLVLIPFIAKVFDQTLHAFCCRAPPVGPGVGTKGLVPDQEGHTNNKVCVV